MTPKFLSDTRVDREQESNPVAEHSDLEASLPHPAPASPLAPSRRSHRGPGANVPGRTPTAILDENDQADSATKPRHLQLADLRRIRRIRPPAPRKPAFGRGVGENGLTESPKRTSVGSAGGLQQGLLIQSPPASSSLALVATVELAVEIRLMDDRAVR